MEEFSKKIELMLKAVLEEEKAYIEELGLDENYDAIEDILIDETEELDFDGQYGWQKRRDYEYIYEKKGNISSS